MTPTALATSRALRLPDATSSLALWGSSSMNSEGAPTARLADLLQLTMCTRPVRNFSLGATHSSHSALARGARTPRVTLPDGYRGGRVRVTLSPDVNRSAYPQDALRIPGTIGGTLRGVLSGDGSTWWFESTGGSGGSGAFVSDWRDATRSARHILWVGKNNIVDRGTVISDIDAMTRLARDPSRDNLVLGNWLRTEDPPGSDTRAAVNAVNNHLRSTYGRAFLDVQQLLTSPDSLSSHPVAGLHLMDDPGVRADLRQGWIPQRLMADRYHLDRVGNTIVFAAIVARMQELSWL